VSTRRSREAELVRAARGGLGWGHGKGSVIDDGDNDDCLFTCRRCGVDFECEVVCCLVDTVIHAGMHAYRHTYRQTYTQTYIHMCMHKCTRESTLIISLCNLDHVLVFI
jgi:hypothetical protein